MLPHQRNKVDINSLSAEEQKLFRLYGKLPSKKDILKNKLKERKYFDSGDYALSKAGKASDVGVTNIGSQHPLPENIPHTTPNNADAGSPVKEGSHLHSSPMASGEPITAESVAAQADEEEEEQAVEKPPAPAAEVADAAAPTAPPAPKQQKDEPGEAPAAGKEKEKEKEEKEEKKEV